MNKFDLALIGLLLLSVGLPIAACAFVIIRKRLSNWAVLALLSFTSSGAVCLFFANAWSLISYWWIVAVIVAVIWALVSGVRRLRKGTWQYPGVVASLFSGLLLAISAYFILLDITAIGNTRPPAESVELAFPFKDGVFAIVQGGAGRPMQGPHLQSPAQVFALDITRINLAGLGRSSLSTADREKWAVWEQPVLSPCGGKVVFARDGIIDRVGVDRETPAGNMVAIECEGVIVLLGHFRQGSVQVITGDTVVTGQLLGANGTSGNTPAPHLHMHAEKPPFDGEFSRNDGVAITFDGRFLWKPGLVIMD